MSKELRKAYALLKKVNEHAAAMQAMDEATLKGQTEKFKARLAQGESLDHLLPEAFATIREADRRVLDKYPYDVQVLAGIVLHQGNIASMKTGEGKSITATMPLYLNALTGKGTFLVTVNAYLADRDGHEYGEVFQYLGLSVAIGVPPLGAEDFSTEAKQEIYQSDVVYTTSDKIGFDYLLEHLTTDQNERFLRPYHYVILDEADAILLDMAQMPLIISGAPRVGSNLFPHTRRFVSFLEKDLHYINDEEKRSVYLTEEGVAFAKSYFGIEDLYSPALFKLNRHINLALRAKELFQNGRDYMVLNHELKLLSDLTGRLLEGNKLQGGLHQAIESKEEVENTRENRAMASITYQNLFVMFEKVAGMTGTAKGCEEELLETYHTRVVEIPTNNPIIRIDDADIIVRTLAEKEQLILKHIKAAHATGQPILVTTSSVKNSTKYSNLLLQEGISHSLLNALSEAKEADMIREAGARDAITVATLMAGRGTDIKIDKEVHDLGGLLIIGTEKMPNQRIELQVRGRAGRLGEPGRSIFYASLEDDLIVRFGLYSQEEIAKKHFTKHAKRKLFMKAQSESEDAAQNTRDLALKFDLAMIKQRDLVYAQRDEIIAGKVVDQSALIEMAETVIDQVLHEKHDHDSILRFIFDNLSFHIPKGFNESHSKDPQKIKVILQGLFSDALQQKKEQLADPILFEKFLRLILLKAIDEAWIEQVDFLEQLKTVVVNRQLAQHHLEYEYRSEAFLAFDQMRFHIYREVMRLLSLSEIEKGADGALVIQFA